jgi:FkbM family methyltransferase
MAGRWALKLVPDITFTIRIPEIGPFLIRARRNRSFWLRDPLLHERFPLAALRALIRPRDVVYDVGANIGLYTRFCVACFQAGRVVAFEPMTQNREQLQRNVTLGEICDKVTIRPEALSDTDETQSLQVDDISSASAVLAAVTGDRAAQGREHYGLPPKSEHVVCRRLDSLLAEGDLAPPDVIKVDIEGAEDMFLAGAVECLARISPRLMVELHGADKARAVCRRLLDAGYHCAGKVDPHLAASGYCRIDDSILERVSGFFDVHFLIAAKEPADLPATVDEFGP